MLPNLAGLGLEPHKAAPTAEFYTLTCDEVGKLEKEGNVEIYSQDTAAAGNEQMFRIAKRRNDGPRPVHEYHWYDGIQLWEWAQGHELDPLRRPWWHEDWMALRNRYDPRFEPPEWVDRLPRGLSDAARAAKARQQSEGNYARYPRVPDNPRPDWPDFGGNVKWVRNAASSGWDLYVGGALRYEVWDADANVRYYEGPACKERKVREELQDGNIFFYKEPRNEERLVEIKFANGQKQFFEGPRNEEHLVQVELPSGEKRVYEGPSRNEHLVQVKLPSGKTQFYLGPPGKEYLERIELPNGKTQFYLGPPDEEHLVRVEYLTVVEHWEGPKGAERFVSTETTETTETTTPGNVA